MASFRKKPASDRVVRAAHLRLLSNRCGNAFTVQTPSGIRLDRFFNSEVFHNRPGTKRFPSRGWAQARSGYPLMWRRRTSGESSTARHSKVLAIVCSGCQICLRLILALRNHRCHDEFKIPGSPVCACTRSKCGRQAPVTIANRNRLLDRRPSPRYHFAHWLRDKQTPSAENAAWVASKNIRSVSTSTPSLSKRIARIMPSRLCLHPAELKQEIVFETSVTPSIVLAIIVPGQNLLL